MPRIDDEFAEHVRGPKRLLFLGGLRFTILLGVIAFSATMLGISEKSKQLSREAEAARLLQSALIQLLEPIEDVALLPVTRDGERRRDTAARC